MHCNDKIPENHNIKKTNLRDNIIHVYDGSDWVAKPLYDTLDDLYGNATSFLSGKFDELKCQLCDKTIEKFNKYIEKMDTKKCFEHVEDEIILILYNARNIVKKTHENLK